MRGRAWFFTWAFLVIWPNNLEPLTLTFEFGVLLKKIYPVNNFQQRLLEIWYFTWAFLVTRSFCWFQKNCPCYLSHYYRGTTASSLSLKENIFFFNTTWPRFLALKFILMDSIAFVIPQPLSENKNHWNLRTGNTSLPQVAFLIILQWLKRV